MNFEQSLQTIILAFPRKPKHVQRLYASQMNLSDVGAYAWVATKKAMLKTSAHAEKEARAIFRDAFGAGKYRINTAGSVEVYGLAPNSGTTCWWLYAVSVERAVERLQY